MSESKELQKREDVALSAQLQEAVLLGGDLRNLSPAQAVEYMLTVCKSLGLNPLTKPFEFLDLSGKRVLYARKDCTEQLRQIHGVSVRIVAREVVEDVYVVTAQATNKAGRCDESIGAVNIKGLTGEVKANALMKAETKAKRRVTLSISGLGMLDETEVDSVPGAQRVAMPEYTPPAKEAPRSEAPKSSSPTAHAPTASGGPTSTTPSALTAGRDGTAGSAQPAASGQRTTTATPAGTVSSPKGEAAPPAASPSSAPGAPSAIDSASDPRAQLANATAEREPGSDDDVDAMDDPNDLVECFDKQGVQSWEPRRTKAQNREFHRCLEERGMRHDGEDHTDDHGKVIEGYRKRLKKHTGKSDSSQLSVREMGFILDKLNQATRQHGTVEERKAIREKRYHDRSVP